MKRLAKDGAVLAALAVAVCGLFAQVLDTDFWSPEDFHALRSAAEAQARDEPLRLRLMLAGGYEVHPIFALEFRSIGLVARPYLIVNLMIHIANSFLAFLLVHSLLHDRRSALIAALLFALTVGSYGKNLMFATGVSSLLYATAILLGTLLYVHSEKEGRGQPISWWSVPFYLIFVVCLFMRGCTFSILAAMFLYNVFFRHERKRPVLHPNFVACVLVALAVIVWNRIESGRYVDSSVSAGAFLRNLPGYLVLMVFPLQQSELIQGAPGSVQGLVRVAPMIRIVAGLTILSYSFFGFVFGSRALRFYLAWTYVMIAPFAFFRYPADWLNLRFLYLVSLGFCVVLTTGTMYAYRLLHHHRFKRYIAFSFLLFYVGVSVFIVSELDRKNEALARHPHSIQTRAEIGALQAH